MAVIGITGGTGFIGSALMPRLLKAGHEVIIFSRSPRPPANTPAGVRYGLWNPATEETDAALWSNVEQVVHLAGAGVADQRWSKGRKAEIVRSRVQGTQFLLATLRKNAPRCKTLVAASAIGYYGPDQKGGQPFVEADMPAGDFLARACVFLGRRDLSGHRFFTGGGAAHWYCAGQRRRCAARVYPCFSRCT